MNQTLILLIVTVSLIAMMVRPFALPEAVPTLGGATLLILDGALSPRAAFRAVGQGINVYLFLAGMMLLAELALVQGVFSWAAHRLLQMAQGSAIKLFTLIYALAVIITVLLSNDATAVVFTPAVAAMTAAAGVAEPLPYLLICAFVANAASFVLPISNPANLVLFDNKMPHLALWLHLFGLASVFSLVATYLLLWLTQRGQIRSLVLKPEIMLSLTFGGKCSLAALGGVVLLLVLAAGLGWPLGATTFGLGIGCVGLVCMLVRQHPWPVVRGVSWGVLPLVAGLFVMVGALDASGITGKVLRLGQGGIWSVGLGLAAVTNVANNLPVGLFAKDMLLSANLTHRAAALIGVDLGPNLSVPGSLATILWLNVIRRHGVLISGWRFFALGLAIMPPALILAIIGLSLSN